MSIFKAYAAEAFLPVTFVTSAAGEPLPSTRQQP